MTSDDRGYVHDPSTVDGGGDGESGGERIEQPPHPEAGEREFDRRGWALVGMILVAFVVAPAIVLLIPPGAEGYRFALLIVPLVPAFLLGLTAIWATTRP